MDREILFRGRYKKGSKWFFGDLLDYAGEAQIWYLDGQEKWNVLVDPSTVGQCTGLTDKNGVKIFEGDIVRANIRNGKPADVVIYESAMFKVFGMSLVTWTHPDQGLEVIGNIHDNPELLEGGTEK